MTSKALKPSHAFIAFLANAVKSTAGTPAATYIYQNQGTPSIRQTTTPRQISDHQTLTRDHEARGNRAQG